MRQLAVRVALMTVMLPPVADGFASSAWKALLARHRWPLARSGEVRVAARKEALSAPTTRSRSSASLPAMEAFDDEQPSPVLILRYETQASRIRLARNAGGFGQS